ncbi:hypothetical protein KKH35_00760, partial [Patescibacteria group bacterium]|nr:hypothetical protein [Patescibacteria group bacterium]
FLTIFLLLIATYFVIITFDVAIRVNNINILVLAVLGVFLTHIFYGVNFLYGFMSGKSFKSRLK